MGAIIFNRYTLENTLVGWLARARFLNRSGSARFSNKRQQPRKKKRTAGAVLLITLLPSCGDGDEGQTRKKNKRGRHKKKKRKETLDFAGEAEPKRPVASNNGPWKTSRYLKGFSHLSGVGFILTFPNSNPPRCGPITRPAGVESDIMRFFPNFPRFYEDEKKYLAHEWKNEILSFIISSFEGCTMRIDPRCGATTCLQPPGTRCRGALFYPSLEKKKASTKAL